MNPISELENIQMKIGKFFSILAMCTTVGGVASDSITWSVRREIDS